MFWFLFTAEQLEIDPPEASLKRVEMRGETGHEIEVALPDEFKGDRSGPVFFPDAQDEEDFKKKFADARILPLSPSSFKGVNGVYHLRMDRTGVPSRSYYALSLPKYAVPVPSQIIIQDPRSARMLDKYVVRDDIRKCYVIYIECQSADGTFDFHLDIKFTVEKRPGIFGNSEYPDDGHLKRYSKEIASDNGGKLSEQIELVKHLLADKTNQEEGTTGGLPQVGNTSHANRERLSKADRCAKVVDEVKEIKRMHDHDRLTITEIREEHNEFEVWKIVETCLDPEGQEEFRSPGCWDGQGVAFALFILSKEYKKQPATINDWVKRSRRHSREKT